MAGFINFVKNSHNISSDVAQPTSSIPENEEDLKRELIQLGLKAKNALFLIQNGDKFFDKTQLLAQKYSISDDKAEKALKILKSYRIKKVAQKEITNFERLVKKNPSESLKDIALLNEIHEDVVAAYLDNSEASLLTESEKVSIKELLDNGFSLTDIADELKLSQKKIDEFVEHKFILFNGKDGNIVLKIINKHFGKHPVNKLRELITKKDVKLQEIICFEIPKSNQSEYDNVKDYFDKFEESQNFFEIEKKLTIEARTCIGASSLDNVEELSLKLNRVEKVIHDYLLRFHPDNKLMSHHTEEQLEKIRLLKRNLGIDSHISHTSYRMIISDTFDSLIEKAQKRVGNFQRKILTDILPLAFYYIKCSLSLEELTQIISSTTNIQLTTLDIFHLIFQMSDPVVRGLCIEHYSFSNPVPFYYPILGLYPPEQKFCQFEICKELWYSLQQFSGLVSFGLGWASWNPIGKSHLLDLMFETDFVKGSPQNSPFHLGSIDIQMTKNLFGDRNEHETTKWTYIDCHRCTDINLIRDICQNLDIALIHVSYSDYTENNSRLEAKLNEFTVDTKHVYVLVRDFSGNDQKEKRIKVCGKFSYIFIPNLIKHDQNILLELRKYGYMILHSITTDPRLVGSNFLEKLISRYGSWENLKREKELIESVKKDISTSTNTEGKIDFSFLSYYPHFVKYMSSYYEASSQTDQKISDELNEKCELFAKHLEDAEISAIAWHFNEILSEKNSTLILWKLSQELKMLSKGKISSIDGTAYTLEILWRESLLSSKYNPIGKSNPTRKYYETLSSNFSLHVERGEPFELIDGDNLRFFNQDINVLMSKFYGRQFPKDLIFSKTKRPPIVVSIFGPQSSGKSTLLNYCFGCKFLTSAGRCTKGIYASLSKLSQPINDSDHFLILDTEGLDSSERGKNIQDTSCINFDRTMVLFCLAVSQVAIINVKGDLGEEMRNLLQICAYSLNKLKVSKVAAPKIFFVLNQQADPDPNKHLKSINSLLEKLNEESYLMETEGLKISDLIQVSKENLSVLPSAFNSESLNTQITKLFVSDLCKLSPTISFANKSTNLRMSIIKQLKNDPFQRKDFSNMKDDYKIPFNTMSEWLEMSGVIWDTIVKYQDIVKYSNTDELKCSKALSKILSEIMKCIIYSNKEKYRDITEKLIFEIKNINRWSPPKVMLEEVKIELNEAFEKYQEEALTIFFEKCKSDPLLKKMDYMCDDSKSNLNRLIYMEKKIYEDKLKFEIKARLTEIKLTEKTNKFQLVIEKNADRYLDLTIEEQTKEFEGVWISCFSKEKNEGEEDVLAEKFDDLYSVFRMESKTMENKQTIYTLFRDSKFDMDSVLQDLRETMLSRFCDESNPFARTQFIYPWKENRVPIKEMTPYTDNAEFEYLSKDSLYKMVEQSKTVFQAAQNNLDFSTWVPAECHPLVKHCSGYYNHPDIIWKQEKRKQILLLASQLKDPNDFERSTWGKFIDDLAKNIQEFTNRDPNISHSIVKEIVNFLYRICKVVNYEINFIEAKLTNAAERTISTYAFAFAFKSLLKTKFENQRKKSNENERKINDLEYFLQKVENRKLARGNWDRKEMREGVQTIANKFAGDFLGAIRRGVSTECEQNINERYFDDQKDRLSFKSILLLANKKITEEVFHNNKLDNENNAILKSYKINKISKEQIQEFGLLVENYPLESLEEVALAHGIDEYVVSAYLANSETTPLTGSEKLAIKEHLDAGFPLAKIAEDLKISQKKIEEYVENKSILFNGKDGEAVLAIIIKHFRKDIIVKLREMIAKQDMDLQEKICFELLERNESEHVAVKNYFMKFEESKNFFKIKTLSIEAKTCIRANSLDNAKELSVKLNVIERVIRDYFLQFFPDKQLMLDCSQDQFTRIQYLKAKFLTDKQISHTTYRMIISDSSETIIQNAKNLSRSPNKVFVELLPLAFYYLKCSLPLEEIAQIISSMTNIPLTTLDLFHLIFQMSDPVVRGLCIEHYSFSNPVPFYYPILSPYPPEQTSCQFEICKELWYSLQQFSGLVSFGLGWASWNPIGKSHLLDLMFETDFVKGSPQNSPFHLGSIDIQMTKNLFGLKDSNESTQWAYMDCHGCSDFNLIQDICQNLDIALIHVSYSDYAKNYPRLMEDLKKITNHTEHVYVLIRDCTDTELSPKQISVDKKKYHFLFIGNLLNFGQNDLRSSALREIGYKVLHSASSKPIGTDYLEKLLLRQSNWNISEKELIQSIKNDICSNVQDGNKINFSFLSYYPHFIEYMRCFNEVSRETDQKGIDALNEKCDQLAKDLEDAKMSAVVLHFNEILSHENSTLILWKLSQELSMLSKQTLPDINQTVYTLEILWREALLSNKYNLTKKKEKQQVNDYLKTFSSHFSNHVERGEPFELIDGDNLRFFNQDINILLSKFYEKQNNGAISLQNKQRPPIVVSIFGPQSSGKSTLLNYCFGCKFLTSAGRCTKGIYASLSKLSQPINNSEHFLILDTEGLDAIERGNTIQDTSCIHFDRTMVLFCLAVSQVVIINVKGDIGEEMRNLLQICAYSLNKLKVSKVAAPKIFFVLNQQAHPDPNKHLSSINTLLRKLNEESYVMETEGLKISDLIAVSEENLFVLPSAFNSESLNSQMTKLFDSKLCKSSPTIDFANRCADLRLSIIRQLKADTSDNESSFNTMSEWLEMSGVIWDTIIKYQDIVKYRNVEELKCSNKLNVIVGGLVKSTIHSKKKEYENMTKEVIKKIKEITKSSPTKVMLEDVKKDLDIVFKEHWEKALADFEAQCKDDSLLKRMGYICDEAKLNLNRLIYIEKKIYEDKLKFEIKARLTRIKLTEKMTKFQESIEKNADRYLELNIEEQKKEFEVIWLSCLSNDTKEEETDFDEIFDNLYSVFRMESKIMENKSTIYTLFRHFNFEMDTTIKTLSETILSRFCDESNKFAGTEQFIYPWRENKVPLKDMKPQIGKLNCEYLSKESLYVIEVQNKRSNIVFRKYVPQECHPLIKYCSGYFNYPDIIWNPVKRKQILLLASNLKDPTDPERSTWEKLITDISKRVQEFTEIDQMISHSTVKEIVGFLSHICKLVNYEIKFIEAKLTNAAERKISTLAFAFAFKSILKAKFEEQKEGKSKEKEKKNDSISNPKEHILINYQKDD